MKKEDWIPHLAELRKRSIVAIAWFLVAFCAGVYVAPHILQFIKSQPSAANVEWNVFSFTDGLFIYMKCAFLFALTFSMPVILYQIWAFVRPGLTSEEAKGVLSYLPAAFALFLSGLSFSYYVAFPMMIQFMGRMNRSVGATETYGLGNYFSFLFDMVLPLSLAFELPVVMLFLTRLGIVTPERLRHSRKYAYLGLAILGSCISPPDFVSHLSVTVPLILLFELSVLVSGRSGRRSSAESPSGG